ncbi:MAG: preprotein translocase subunit SecG [Pseudomonadota bacterium]
MNALLIVHILISAVLIILVFMQYSRGADLGAGIGGGGGSANSVFGASGSADFLSKLTGVVGILFFISALGIGAMYTSQRGKVNNSLMKNYVPKAEPVAPPAKSSAIPLSAPAVQAVPAAIPVTAASTTAPVTTTTSTKVESIKAEDKAKLSPSHVSPVTPPAKNHSPAVAKEAVTAPHAVTPQVVDSKQGGK